MDYELRIHKLEKDIADLKEMKDLQGSRLDIALELTFRNTVAISKLTENIQANTDAIAKLTIDVKILVNNVDKLIAAMLRDHPNGKE